MEKWRWFLTMTRIVSNVKGVISGKYCVVVPYSALMGSFRVMYDWNFNHRLQWYYVCTIQNSHYLYQVIFQGKKKRANDMYTLNTHLSHHPARQIKRPLEDHDWGGIIAGSIWTSQSLRTLIVVLCDLGCVYLSSSIWASISSEVENDRLCGQEICVRVPMPSFSG